MINLASSLSYLSYNQRVKVSRLFQNNTLSTTLWTFSYRVDTDTHWRNAVWNNIDNLVVKTEDIDKTLALLIPLVDKLYVGHTAVNTARTTINNFQSLCHDAGIPLQ